ncbi:hypothetical protein TNCV_4164831, partial [Trichonephila clavipes]
CLTGDNVGEPLLKSLWVGRLPNGTQTILALLNENLDQIATVADKINDLTFFQGINSVAATSEKNRQLEQQIAQLTQQVSEQTSFVKRSRSPARNSSHFRNRSKSRNRFKRYDEAHFWLNGYVNIQNCRIWSEANPQVYVETPLHPEKLTVWCALWAGGILLQKR